MDYKKFADTIKNFAPDHKAEAIPIWRDFAAECVDREQFVHFEVTTDKASAVEKWLEVLSAGFCAVSENFGKKAASSVVNLSCERCCLYPGEMMQAAICLENGGSSKQILAMIESGELDCSNLFEPMSRQEAEKHMAQIGTTRPKSVLAQLKTPLPQPKHEKPTPKKSVKKER